MNKSHAIVTVARDRWLEINYRGGWSDREGRRRWRGVDAAFSTRSTADNEAVERLRFAERSSSPLGRRRARNGRRRREEVQSAGGRLGS